MTEDIFTQLEPLAERIGKCMTGVNQTLDHARTRLREIALGMTVTIPLPGGAGLVSLAYMRHQGIWDLYILSGDHFTPIVNAGMMHRFQAAGLIPELVTKMREKTEKLLEGME